jgi:hypothetical protein
MINADITKLNSQLPDATNIQIVSGYKGFRMRFSPKNQDGLYCL